MKAWITRICMSKTLLFSMLLAVLGTLQASLDIFTPYLTPQTMGFVTLAIGVAVAILRVVTTQALSDK
jgi:hypothetical protein